MDLELTSGLVLLLTAAPIALGLGWYAWINRALPGALPFLFAVPLGAIWALGSACELLATSLEGKVFCANIEYVAICFIPVAWLAVAVDYAGHRDWLNRWRLLGLSVIPITTLTLLWTDDLHHLMRSTIWLDTSGSLDIVGRTWGPWFWIHSVYSYGLLLASVAVLLRVCLTAPPLYRRQPLALLAGSLAPLAAHVVFMCFPKSGPAWDYTAVSFIFGGIVIAWGLFRVRLFNLVPVARHALVEGMSDGVLVLDEADRVVDLNKSAQTLVGKPAKQILARPLAECWPAWSQIGAPYAAGASRAQLRLGSEGETRHFAAEWSPLTRRDFVMGRLVVLRDVTERVLMEESLRQQALTDGLTGLPNRALFMARLDDAIRQARRHSDKPFAVMVLDLDRFKLINDSIGHLAGDVLLQSVAGKLKRCVREVDTVARMGGDEFMILLHEISSTRDLLPILARIQEELRMPVHFRQQEMTAGSSVGVVLWDPSYDDPEDLLRAADTAMYQAKEAGRGCHRIFDETMHESELRTLRAETDLRTSLRQRDFSLAYQPVVDLRTGAIRSLEALLRWHHPQRGIVLPKDFISIAENSGLIVPLGEMGLEEVCSQLSRWQSPLCPAAGLPVSLNLSPRQLNEPDFVAAVVSRLAEWRVPSDRLILEITESALIRDPLKSKLVTRELREMGLRLCLDDFGTGWSSLQHLSTFPVMELKIDRSFIARLVRGNTDYEVVRALTALAHTLGLEVTGEGVEHSEQWRLLQELGCDYAQGYYVGRPMEADELLVFLGDLQRGSCELDLGRAHSGEAAAGRIQPAVENARLRAAGVATGLPVQPKWASFPVK